MLRIEQGGSHDRTELLPLKAGVTIMALGAMSKCPGLSVKIVPVGVRSCSCVLLPSCSIAGLIVWLLLNEQLTYFHGHRFRSRAYVDIGAPISVDPALVAKYNQGKEAKVCLLCGRLIVRCVDCCLLLPARGLHRSAEQHPECAARGHGTRT